MHADTLSERFCRELRRSLAEYYGAHMSEFKGVTVREALNSFGPEVVVLWGAYTEAELDMTL
ncbi:MAG: hypothetical protein RBU21_06000 [FCB group bacterium]|jgi:hypothetical protein|nr:hypothetical protein [FCB group bacterium]